MVDTGLQIDPPIITCFISMYLRFVLNVLDRVSQSFSAL